jgi:hypothetical protein
LIEHHENWLQDTFLCLPLKAKDAAWSAVWGVLRGRKGNPTHHDVLDALRFATLSVQDQRKAIHDDQVPFVPFDVDGDES